MTNNNIPQFIADDSFSQFIKSLYQDQDYVQETISINNYPHTYYYLSNFHPIFLQYLDGHILPRAKHLFLRDGALFLLKSLIQFNSQLKEIDYLLIPEQLQYLIPIDLRNNCYSYTYALCNKQQRNVQEVILFATFDHDVDRTLELFFSWLEEIKKYLANNTKIKKVSLCFNSPPTLDEHNYINEPPRHYKQALLTTGKILSDYNLTFINTTDVSNIENHAELAFSIFNPYMLHYADSFITHMLLAQGATPFLIDKHLFPLPDKSFQQLSNFHGINIKKINSDQKFFDSFFASPILQGEMQHIITQERYSNLMKISDYNMYFTTTEFKELVLELAKEHEKQTAL